MLTQQDAEPLQDPRGLGLSCPPLAKSCSHICCPRVLALVPVSPPDRCPVDVDIPPGGRSGAADTSNLQQSKLHSGVAELSGPSVRSEATALGLGGLKKSHQVPPRGGRQVPLTPTHSLPACLRVSSRALHGSDIQQGLTVALGVRWPRPSRGQPGPCRESCSLLFGTRISVALVHSAPQAQEVTRR